MLSVICVHAFQDEVFCNGAGLLPVLVNELTDVEMTLYIDKAITRDESAIQVDLSWHPSLHLAALGAFSEDRGGTVDIVDRWE